MHSQIIQKIAGHNFRQYTDPKNIGLYIFVLIILAISWSGIKAIQTNYDLQKQISKLKQQNTVLELQNENTALKNKYLHTDQYLDLAARQNLGLAGPGEQVLLVPQNVALKYVDSNIFNANAAADQTNRPQFVKNLTAWRDFLLGRKLLIN